MVATRNILTRYVEGKISDLDAASSMIETNQRIVTVAGNGKGTWANPLLQFWAKLLVLLDKDKSMLGVCTVVNLIYTFAQHPVPFKSESEEEFSSMAGVGKERQRSGRQAFRSMANEKSVATPFGEWRKRTAQSWFYVSIGNALSGGKDCPSCW
jgi:hypothetical protein